MWRRGLMPRSGDVILAVGFNPRSAEIESRRVATIESAAKYYSIVANATTHHYSTFRGLKHHG